MIPLALIPALTSSRGAVDLKKQIDMTFRSGDARSETTPLNLVALSGNVRTPSRTATLVRAIAESIGNKVRVSQTFLSMSDAPPSIMGALTRDALTPDGLAYVRQVEAADILVIGSPIYRASYTGALKHLFDLVDYRALTGAVGVIAATGGSAVYALATEHQFRPLSSYFGMTAIPTTVYALETDFKDAELISVPVRHRIERMAAEVAVFAPLADRRHAARQHAA